MNANQNNTKPMKPADAPAGKQCCQPEEEHRQHQKGPQVFSEYTSLRTQYSKEGNAPAKHHHDYHHVVAEDGNIVNEERSSGDEPLPQQLLGGGRMHQQGRLEQQQQQQKPAIGNERKQLGKDQQKL